MLGASAFAYLGLPQTGLGFPFPTLQGQWTVRPTFGRITGYFLGRWAGYLILGALFSSLGFFFHSPLCARLIFGNVFLLAIFMFLFFAIQVSPDLAWARATDPSRWELSVPVLGGLSSFTLTAPMLIMCLLTFLQPTVFHGLVFATNFFLGQALFSLPFLLNVRWVKTVYYRWLLKGMVLVGSLSTLISSVVSFINT
ncbi:MAG: hypothetical protein HGA76_08360 [Candidatus Firestonebacteria bacterium]|nr:hypothetical protein [Candidatus Firestonebacteria bacterium]